MHIFLPSARQSLSTLVITITAAPYPQLLAEAAMRCPCCDKQENNRGAWSKEEDQKLISYIRANGEVSWRSLPKAAGLLRCGKSCRLRWINYLRPDVKRGNFKEDEEDLIIKLHALLGNRWSLIAGRLPGRTDNEVKNYWNSHLRKRLRSMGVDPDNHRLTQGAGGLRRRAERSSTTDEAAVLRHGGGGHWLSDGLCSSASTAVKCMDQAEEKNSNCSDGVIELPDLNLDLPISAVPCKNSKNGGGEFITGQACAEVASSHSRRPPSTTLLLFR